MIRKYLGIVFFFAFMFQTFYMFQTFDLHGRMQAFIKIEEVLNRCIQNKV